MDTLLQHWLRPTQRARRAVAAVVVVALLGWLSLAAGHVHLDGHDGIAAHAHQHAGEPHAGDRHAGDRHAGDGAGADDGRTHPCGLCAALERGAGPAAAPAFTIAACAHLAPPHALPDAPSGTRAPAPYRSRAPPHA